MRPARPRSAFKQLSDDAREKIIENNKKGEADDEYQLKVLECRQRAERRESRNKPESQADEHGEPDENGKDGIFEEFLEWHAGPSERKNNREARCINEFCEKNENTPVLFHGCLRLFISRNMAPDPIPESGIVRKPPERIPREVAAEIGKKDRQDEQGDAPRTEASVRHNPKAYKRRNVSHEDRTEVDDEISQRDIMARGGDQMGQKLTHVSSV